jgi:hypothetical protein
MHAWSNSAQVRGCRSSIQLTVLPAVVGKQLAATTSLGLSQPERPLGMSGAWHLKGTMDTVG